MRYALAVILAFAQPVSAQSGGNDWSRLNELVKGDRVQVEPFEGRKSKGSFVAVSGNEFRLSVEGSETAIQRSAIKKVRVKRASARMGKAALGAAIGGGVAAAVIIGISENYGDGPFDPDIIGGAIAVGVGIGFAAGAATPGYKTVYKAERP